MTKDTPPVGYLRRVRFAFDDLMTGEHREGVWDQDSILTPEQVAHQVFSSLTERRHTGPGFMGGPGPDLGDDPDGDNS